MKGGQGVRMEGVGQLTLLISNDYFLPGGGGKEVCQDCEQAWFNSVTRGGCVWPKFFFGSIFWVNFLTFIF